MKNKSFEVRFDGYLLVIAEDESDAEKVVNEMIETGQLTIKNLGMIIEGGEE